MTSFSFAHSCRLLAPVAAALLVVSCMTRPPAPVERARSAAAGNRSPPARRPAPPARAAGDAPPPTHVVKRGETLYQIALDHGARLPRARRMEQHRKRQRDPRRSGARARAAGRSRCRGRRARRRRDDTACGRTCDRTGRQRNADSAVHRSGAFGPRQHRGVQKRAEGAEAAVFGAGAGADAAEQLRRRLPRRRAGHRSPRLRRPRAAVAQRHQRTVAAAPARIESPRVPEIDDDNIDWAWPAAGKVISGFSETANLKGIDIAGKAGQPVLASGRRQGRLRRQRDCAATAS